MLLVNDPGVSAPECTQREVFARQAGVQPLEQICSFGFQGGSNDVPGSKRQFERPTDDIRKQFAFHLTDATANVIGTVPNNKYSTGRRDARYGLCEEALHEHGR